MPSEAKCAGHVAKIGSAKHEGIQKLGLAAHEVTSIVGEFARRGGCAVDSKRGIVVVGPVVNLVIPCCTT
ncbi:hypothetical protein D3C80_1903660 [compost metagenome]